ncbi:glycosyltransferase family 2 protein [Castellaniella ginsengisoli]|uniref:Glycosyltransferase family 2 protein n=1 Tax=Castellaniella ginsengisoli TaxID=546114 RepID=A0AB39EQR8_9BURK
MGESGQAACRGYNAANSLRFPMKTPTIALVMIVKNEAATLARCLSSVQGHVDDIIVLDTGSTDDTVGIAQGFGARVHHFGWVDDFSAARNAALDHSSADWNLILDADNWLESGHEELRRLGTEPFLGQIAIVNRFMQGNEERHTIEWGTRILPKGVRYAGRIHEQAANPDGFSRKRLRIRVGHDGYMPEGLAAKKGRNEALLRMALAETPEDPYLLYQLGKELALYDRHDEAADCFLSAVSLCARDQSFRYDLIMRSLFTLKQAGHLERAILLAEEEFPYWQDSPDYFFCVADVFLDWAIQHPAEAESQFLPIVESSWLKCLEIGERPDLSESVAGRGSYLAAQNLAVLYENTGRAAQAAEYRDKARAMRPG